MPTHRDVSAAIAHGVTYTEDTGRFELSRPVRDCRLWHDGVDESISGLQVVSFRQRFGAVAVPAEGIGGVETRPPFRRQGYVRTVLSNALERMATRVPVIFVSEAIQELYEKLGCVTCQADAHVSVSVRNVERMAARRTFPSAGQVRGFVPADLPAMVTLYNTVHGHRPWTHVRASDWNQLHRTQT